MAKKYKAPKYKVGDMVYSYQNPNKPASITRVRVEKDPEYQHAYKLSLPAGNGYTRSSNWINQSSLRKTKPRK